MSKGKNTYRILLAGGNDRMCELLSELLPRSGYEPVLRVSSAGELRRKMLDLQVDIVIINAPLKDEFGTQAALDAAADNLAVMLLVPGETLEQITYQVEDEGIITLGKPVNKQIVYTAVKMLSALRAGLLRMEKKNRALQDKMTDIRTLNRAKWLLIEQHRMTEVQAHHYIEKQAMDMRLSSREVAESIIRTYDA